MTPSAISASSGVTTVRTKRERSSPTISTMQAPPASATSGDIASQSM